jgi:hypothetical protein
LNWRCFRLPGIGIGRFEGLRDDRQMPLQEVFDGLADVLHQMPSIGDLLGLGRGFGGSLGIGRVTVAADQLDARMRLQPCLDVHRVAVGQEVDHVARLEVNNDGAVALSFTPGPVVNPHDSRCVWRSCLCSFDATQQRIGTGWYNESLGQSATGLTPEGRAYGEVSPGQSRRRSGISCREVMKRLDEDSTRAPVVGAEESADGDPKPDPMAEDGLLGEASRIATVDPPTLLPTRGTGGMRGRRDDSEGQSIAVEIVLDQAGARRSWDKSKQDFRVTKDGAERAVEIIYLCSLIIKSAEDPLLHDHF